MAKHNSIEFKSGVITGVTKNPEENNPCLVSTSEATKELADRIKAIPIVQGLKTGDIVYNGISPSCLPNEIPLWLGRVWIPIDKEPKIYSGYKDLGHKFEEKDGKFLMIDYSNRFLRITAHAGDVIEDAIMNHHHYGGMTSHPAENSVLWRYGGTREDCPQNKARVSAVDGGTNCVQAKTSMVKDTTKISSETYPKYVSVFARKIGTWLPSSEILEKWKDDPKIKDCYIFDSETGEYMCKTLSPINWYETTIHELVYWSSLTSTFINP